MRAAKVDKVQPEIVKALRNVGATVMHLHRVGSGCPDLAVGFKCENYFLECKQPNGKINELQAKWHSEWAGNSFIVRSVDEALDAIGAKRKPADSWEYS